LLHSNVDRDSFIKNMNAKGVDCIFHYVPLHLSNAGRNFGRNHGNLSITENHARYLVRLPFWVELTKEKQAKVIHTVFEVLKEL